MYRNKASVDIERNEESSFERRNLNAEAINLKLQPSIAWSGMEANYSKSPPRATQLPLIMFTSTFNNHKTQSNKINRKYKFNFHFDCILHPHYISPSTDTTFSPKKNRHNSFAETLKILSQLVCRNTKIIYLVLLFFFKKITFSISGRPTWRQNQISRRNCSMIFASGRKGCWPLRTQADSRAKHPEVRFWQTFPLHCNNKKNVCQLMHVQCL